MKRPRLQNFLLGLVGVLVIALGISLHTATTATISFHYAVTDLGTLGGNCSDNFCAAGGINDVGQIAGNSTASDGSSHGFLWQNGQMRDLGSLSVGHINNAGQVIGSWYDSDHAFKWENGTVTDLGTLNLNGFTESLATDINNAGQVVGYSDNIYSFEEHAVSWNNNNTITDLSSNSSSNSHANGINNQGQVVGYLTPTNSNDVHATLWNNGTIIDLGTFGGMYSLAIAINDKGQIVGIWVANDGSPHSFLWQNGQGIDLGNLNGNPLLPCSINNKGTVVGSSYSSTSNSFTYIHAFVRRNGILRDLNNLISPNSGWVLRVAFDINNKGQIVGFGVHNGQNSPFLATPVTVTQ